MSDPARVKVCCANRRGGKTENLGREAGARCIERDGYVVWVVASDLGEYSRNWLDRKPVGLVQMLRDIGLEESSGSKTRDFRLIRGNQSAIIAIEFPRWGSMIRMVDGEDERPEGRHNCDYMGGRAHEVMP